MNSRRGRWALCAALGGGLVAAAAYGLLAGDGSPAPARAAAPAAIGRDYYGVNGGLAFAAASPHWDRSAARIDRLGVGTVRRDAFWSAVEPSPPRHGVHRYRWRSTDRLVASLARAGLRWYPIVDYATDWAGVDGWESPPRAGQVGNYAAFAGALAGRYGSGGSFWSSHPSLPALPVTDYEIWNEPNFHHFWPQQSYAPRRLGAMYLAAQRRISAADPSAQVVLGGLSTHGLPGFLARLARAHPALRQRLQAVGYHPYGGGPGGGLAVTFARIRHLRSTLRRLFGSRPLPIEITETGWAVPPTPEAWRARRLRDLAAELPGSGCEVTRFIVFAWTTAPAGSPVSGAGYGIARPGGRPTPAARAFRAGIEDALAGRVPPGETLHCGDGQP